MGRTRIRDICTDGRTDRQPGDYMLPQIFRGQNNVINKKIVIQNIIIVGKTYTVR
jgi:hypothetical protein